MEHDCPKCSLFLFLGTGYGTDRPKCPFFVFLGTGYGT